MTRIAIWLLGAGISAVASGCATLLPTDEEDLVNVVQRSRYCNSKTPNAELHYFSTPAAFSAWIDRRGIRELRSGAASLRGVLVLEMGQRPTAGYRLEPIAGRSRIEQGTLTMALRWVAPDPNDQVTQVIISPCVVIAPPKGEYSEVEVVDRRGDLRARVTLDRRAGAAPRGE